MNPAQALVEQEWRHAAVEADATGSARPAARETAVGRRLVFVDYARALAVLFMVQGHALDVLLAHSYRGGTAWEGWLFLRGLTSCSFLMLSGVAFSVTSLRHWDDQRRWSIRVFRRLRRAIFFLALAYIVRFPAGHLGHLQWVSPEGWRSFFVVDILQVVAVSLLALQGIVAASRNPRQFGTVAGVAAAAVVLATPLVWQADWTGWPAWLAAYLTPANGSLFPVFPWAGYLLAGAAIGVEYQQRSHRRSSLEPPRWLLSLGAAAIAVGTASLLLPWSAYVQADVWRSSPAVFLVRGGSVLVVLGLLARASEAVAGAPPLVRALAAESLLVYIVHVCVLYGSRWNPGLGRMVGQQGPVETFAWIVGLLSASALLAWSWQRAKEGAPTAARLIRFGVIGWIFGSVLL